MRAWGEGARLTIGSFTSIAAGVEIFLGGEHRTDWVTTYPFSALWPEAQAFQGHPRSKGDVTVGSDVWIGAEAVILSGITIGHGAVIGARAVVASDVPPYGVVVGNPAKLAKLRFEPAVIRRLLAVAWWEWGEKEIARALPELLSSDIGRFLEKAEAGVYAST